MSAAPGVAPHLRPHRSRHVSVRSAMGLTVALLGLIACGEAPAERPAGAWMGAVDTTAAGRIVVHNPDTPLREEAITLRERFRLGALEGSGPDVFGEIRDVEVGPDGAVYVLDGQAEEVRVFGPDGTYLRSFGRSGEGPGELGRPAGMAFDPDGRLWVMSWSNARYTAFEASTGELAEERRRAAAFGMFPWPGGFDATGRLIDVGIALDDDPRGTRVLLRLDTAFVPADTLPMPQIDERHSISFRRDGLTVMSMTVPYAPQPAWAIHPDGGIVVGDGAVYRLHRIGFDADTAMTIELGRPAIEVTGAEADSALDAFRERVAEAAGSGVTPDREPRVPSTRPAHGALFVDDEDRIWVRRTMGAGEDPGWDVFGPDGRYLAVASIPVLPSFVAPSLRGGRLAIATANDGVPGVVVFDLVR